MTLEDAIKLFKDLSFYLARAEVETEIVLRSRSKSEHVVEFRCDETTVSRLADFLDAVLRTPDGKERVYDGELSVRTGVAEARDGDVSEPEVWVVLSTRGDS